VENTAPEGLKEQTFGPKMGENEILVEEKAKHDESKPLTCNQKQLRILM